MLRTKKYWVRIKLRTDRTDSLGMVMSEDLAQSLLADIPTRGIRSAVVWLSVGTADFHRARPAAVPASTAARLAAMVDAGDAWSVSVVPARRWPPPRRPR